MMPVKLILMAEMAKVCFTKPIRFPMLYLQVFKANSDSYSAEHVYLPTPIKARFVKIHVQSWNKHPSMRVELIGCQGQKLCFRASNLLEKISHLANNQKQL